MSRQHAETKDKAAISSLKMPFLYTLGRITGLIASVAFVIAFILTLWPSRSRLAASAVLYVIGFLSGITFSVYFTGGFAWSISSLSRMSTESSPVLILLLGLVRPAFAVGYALGAAVLLWPSIPQEKALRLGKLLHLAVGLPAAGLAGLRPLSPVASAFGVGWLVYVLLWFRIREGYVTFLSSRNSEPKHQSGMVLDTNSDALR